MEHGSLYWNGNHKGDAEGRMEYDIPSGGETGSLLSYVHVTDENLTDILLSNFTGGWSTGRSWLSEGLVEAQYQLVFQEQLRMDVRERFTFGDGGYGTEVAMSLNDEPQYLVVGGHGRYGGGDVNQW